MCYYNFNTVFAFPKMCVLLFGTLYMRMDVKAITVLGQVPSTAAPVQNKAQLTVLEQCRGVDELGDDATLPRH